jgi:hypothetical protein
MKKGFFYTPVGVAGIECIVASLLTWIVILQAANPTPDAPEPWYSWFLLPGLLIGMILTALTGGVNSGVPDWLRTLAVCVANGLCWTPVAYIVIRTACHSCITRSRSDV